MKRCCRRVSRWWALCCVLFLLPGPWIPAETVWQGGDDDWFEPGNWSAGVPTTATVAVVHGFTTATINNAIAEAQALQVGRTGDGTGRVQVENGGQLDVVEAIRIGDEFVFGGMDILNASTVTCAIASIGEEDGFQLNSVTVDGGVWFVAGHLDVGTGAPGRLQVLNGATVEVGSLVAGNPSGFVFGNTDISGPGSSLIVNSPTVTVHAGSITVSDSAFYGFSDDAGEGTLVFNPPHPYATGLGLGSFDVFEKAPPGTLSVALIKGSPVNATSVMINHTSPNHVTTNTLGSPTIWDGVFDIAHYGPGRTTIPGNHNLHGFIEIFGGALLIDGSISPQVFVFNGGTFGGVGTVTNDVDFFQGSTISPGLPTGVLHIHGSPVLSGGSTNAVHVIDASGDPYAGHNSLLSSSGTLIIQASELFPVHVQVLTLDHETGEPGSLSNFNPTQPYTFPFLQAPSGQMLGFDPNKFLIDTSQWHGFDPAQGEVAVVYLPLSGVDQAVIAYTPTGCPHPVTYPEFAALHFGDDVNNPELRDSLWGPTANPDGDRFTNQDEWLFGLDPNVADGTHVWKPALTNDAVVVPIQIGTCLPPDSWQVDIRTNTFVQPGWAPLPEAYLHGPLGTSGAGTRYEIRIPFSDVPLNVDTSFRIHHTNPLE